MEVRFENGTMVEILPPDYKREYLACSQSGKVTSAIAGSPPSPGLSRRFGSDALYGKVGWSLCESAVLQRQ